MRVLIATPLYPPEPGGPATYTKLLEERLPALSIDVKVITFSDVRHLPPIVRHIAYLQRLLKDGKGADAILALDSISVGFPARIASRFLRIPSVVRIGGINSWERASEWLPDAGVPHEFRTRLPKMPFRVRFAFRMERAVLCRARAIITPSRYLKDALAGLGIPAERITVIYNGITPVKNSSSTARSPHTVIAAGRFVPVKRFDVLIEAMAEVIKEIPNAELSLYGDGPSAPVLKERVRALSLGDSVKIAPALPHQELLEKIGSAAVLALPSAHETFSNLIVESMGVGTPVVTTAVGGTPEIITDGENGLLVRPGDAHALAQAILRILQDAELARRLSEKASETLIRFSPEEVAAKTAEVLKDAVH